MARQKRDGDPQSQLASLKYGEAKERLEQILERLEQNEVDVDDLAAQVKEAAGLIRVLHDKLTRTKFEVEKVLEEVAGTETVAVAIEIKED